MSQERRQYDQRSRTPTTVEALPQVVEWDGEATQRALMQSHAAAGHDPDASQMLAGQMLAQPAHPQVACYDPPRLYTQMLLVAGLKKWEIDAMHFTHFFATVREVVLAKEREQQAMSEQSPQYHDLGE